MQDKKYMRRALELAQRATGRTSPNPMVGAVIVKNGKIVGEGYHKKAGTSHAEIHAIRQAGARAKGATLYVTLEPCCTFGKTPPCTGAIIRAGIRKVVIAATDPNPSHGCKGIKILRNNNIKVKTGILEKESRALNEAFEKYITTGMPFVILKMAQSLDGKIATKAGESKWISCEKSRKLVHKLRQQVDAVMVGANTARVDKPRLKEAKLRVIVPAGRVDLKKFLKGLKKKHITSILCEGGGELAASLLKEGLVDKIMFFIAPKIIGGRRAKTSVEGEGITRMADALKLKDISVSKIGADLLVEASCLQG
ncbi:MAG: riboflavin biosynthesis protein RibD [Candidatus Omnitrophica bacterium CG12_big_fil_rev_8_21_14_0_65_43_15]|uniref:Riboflavin biosynthesis protein RibD n=1 Tax=Candidatus Taenaricola geysiri TaxID=1974752 RepID=A0A2J0LPG5_9BACT|nr:MAG: riboflavin biosynthesis protein RibD [Candidatus Omnitrophica bacterium CG1_02_43_210]PIV11741.1 MAG: riboflavin biosynthesis protein RibD [Candidatus Omnitrophica bacterium CG03_land_8_20_14_0_80_43_22]PIW66656.1 MAG: riboflavin biosynthesis protein RibD [Candidatus Omnitrophica bacterium CG12_big_fil_rev_8_21_14_0_65_43_15]PIW80354.1 MAG: riboflavin biosynthesis protein RibD [Candidatus Omnitrophica bacterium CG_4_8_14_3_um_filter_43_15]PIY84051.1 MAG: riboflavin biosynthesis protein 